MLWLIFASFRKFFFTFLAEQWQLVHWDLYIHHIEWDRIQLAKSLSFVGKSHFMTIVVLVGNNMAAAAEPLWNTLRKGRKLEISRAWTFDENVNVFTMNWRKSKMKSFESSYVIFEPDWTSPIGWILTIQQRAYVTLFTSNFSRTNGSLDAQLFLSLWHHPV